MRLELKAITTHKGVLFGLGSALLIGIVLADYATGFDLSLSSLYLVPAVLITWGFGLRAGLGMAFIAYGAWVIVVSTIAHERAALFYVYWEAGIRFATAAAFVVLLDKLKRSLEQAMRQSRRDSLTRLPNRLAFFEAVEAERRRSQRYGGTLSIAYIDLDDFKSLNDQQGHRTGDRALRTVAAAMLRHVRQVDLPARLGGDEFAVVYVATRPDDALKAITQLRNRLLEVVGKHGWPVSFSIGLASFETVPPSVEDMINRADRLMYEVKRQGKGAIRHRVFQP